MADDGEAKKEGNKLRVVTGVIFAAAIAVFLLVGVSSLFGDSGNGGTGAQKQELEVKASFASNQIHLKNTGDTKWSSCEAEINDTYSNKFATFAAGKEYSLPVTSYTNGEGERFNPMTHTINTVSLRCLEPVGDFWYGEF